jgi:hypothetical protein
MSIVETIATGDKVIGGIRSGKETRIVLRNPALELFSGNDVLTGEIYLLYFASDHNSRIKPLIIRS